MPFWLFSVFYSLAISYNVFDHIYLQHLLPDHHNGPPVYSPYFMSFFFFPSF